MTGTCKLYSLVALAACLTAAPSLARTYSFVDYPADQNGHTLTGTIVTDGTLGTLSVSNFLDVDIQVDGPMPFTIEDAVIVDFIFTSTGIEASETEITVADGGRLVLADNASVGIGSKVIEYRRNASTPLYEGIPEAVDSPPSWSTTSPSMGGTDPWVIATFVPSPSAAAAGLLGLSFIATRRR